MTHCARTGDSGRPKPTPHGAARRGQPGPLTADPAAVDALKRALLDEALRLDDLDDRTASMQDPADA